MPVQEKIVILVKSRQVKRRERIGKRLGRQLLQASETMMDYYDAGNASGIPAREDSEDARLLLSRQMNAYGNLMKDIYGE